MSVIRCHNVQVIDSSECEIKLTQHAILESCVNVKLSKCSNIVLMDCVNLDLENVHNVVITGSTQHRALPPKYVVNLEPQVKYRSIIKEYRTPQEELKRAEKLKIEEKKVRKNEEVMKRKAKIAKETLTKREALVKRANPPLLNPHERHHHNKIKR